MTADSGKTQVVIIGTLHGRHTTSAHYSVDVLKRILEDLSPAAILVELPRAWVDEHGRVAPSVLKGADCPETPATNEVAVKLGVRQIAFDRPDRQENFRNTETVARIQRVMATTVVLSIGYAHADQQLVLENPHDSPR